MKRKSSPNPKKRAAARIRWLRKHDKLEEKWAMVRISFRLSELQGKAVVVGPATSVILHGKDGSTVSVRRA